MSVPPKFVESRVDFDDDGFRGLPGEARRLRDRFPKCITKFFVACLLMFSAVVTVLGVNSPINKAFIDDNSE